AKIANFKTYQPEISAEPGKSVSVDKSDTNIYKSCPHLDYDILLNSRYIAKYGRCAYPRSVKFWRNSETRIMQNAFR
ncbi:hypothetical protein, partial [Phocaeicola vulgatus]|uniref:hypothetical protein n=1 Tax=Phocaeicola vulgatus TaxID=821 RepID=UPI000FEF31E1